MLLKDIFKELVLYKKQTDKQKLLENIWFKIIQLPSERPLKIGQMEGRLEVKQACPGAIIDEAGLSVYVYTFKICHNRYWINSFYNKS